MILIIPVITRSVGIEMFGQVMVANAIAGLMGILINYATVQSSVKEIAVDSKNVRFLSTIFIETITLRLVIFSIITILLLSSKVIFNETYFLYISIIPIIFAEAINPFFFLLGQENLKYYNLSNVIAKAATIVGILIFVKSRNGGVWVNFIIGICTTINYLILLVLLIKKYKINFVIPHTKKILKIYRQNFSLVASNFSVHLQQSLMLFALQKWGTDAWLGAYSLCDKVIWSSRLLIISISSALYPKTAKIFNEGKEIWHKFKTEIKLYSGGLFLLLSLTLFIFPEFIIYVLAGQKNETAVLFLRVMAFAPTISALNFINTLDRLLYDDKKSIFQIAFILVILAIIISVTLVKTQSYQWFGSYTLTIEMAALLLYEYKIWQYQPKIVN